MADTAADDLNAGLNQPLKRRLLGSTWLGGAADYIENTNLGDLSQALARMNPVTAIPFLAKDAMEGKLVDNVRTQLGAMSQVPTDVVSSVVGLPGLAGTVSEALGGPKFGQWSVDAANSVQDFAKPMGEFIAGRELPTDILRGSPTDMQANLMRTLAPAAIPVRLPAVVAQGVQKFTTGVNAIDKATALSARTLEVLSPLAINPTPKVVAANVAATSVLAPAAEAGIASYVKGLQEKMDEEAKVGDATATQGAQQAEMVPPQGAPLSSTGAHAADPTQQKITMAGYTSGNDYVDVGIALGLGGVALYSGLQRDKIRRVSEGIKTATTKALTGYDPRNPEDATKMSLLTRLKQDKLNSQAGMQDSLAKVLKSGGYTNAEETLGRFAEMSAQRAGPGVNVRAQTLGTEGKFLDTNIQTMPTNDYFTMIKQLPEASRKELAEVLHARQEDHTRSRLLAKTFNNPAAAANAPLSSHAYNLEGIPTPDLKRIVSQGMAKPEIAAIVNQWDEYMRKSSQYMVLRNRMTPKEAADFLRNNPYYVPPTNLKGTESFFTPRDPVKTQGVPRGLRTFDELGDPVNAMPRYLDEVLRSTEGKAIQRDWMLMMQHAAKQGNPAAQDLLGRNVPLGQNAQGRQIKWRDQYGRAQVQEINDAVVRNSLRDVTNPTALQLSHGFISGMTRLYQSGAVGPLSLAQGTFFAPTSALYAITAGTVLKRPKGVAMGWIDRLVQDATGGKLSLPGDIATMAADSAVRAGVNIGNVLVDRVSQALHNSVVKNGIIARTMSPATADQYSQALGNWYKKSALYEMQQQGLMGPATMDAVDRTQMYRAAGDVLKPPSGLKTSSRFVNDILHAISSAPAMSIMAMNKGLKGTKDEWKVPAAIRNMTGDPARSGAFRGHQWQAEAVSATPWGNVYLQSMARLAESLDPRNPATAGKTAFGIFNAAMAPVAMATWWNMTQGPEYSKHQFFERSADQASKSIYIAQPGAPPDEGWEIPIDPLLRPFKWMGEGIAGALMGAFSGEIFKPENAEELDAFKEMINHRMTGTGEGTMFSSVMNQTVKPPVIPAIGAVGAAAGVQIRDYGDARTSAQNKNQGFVEGTQPDPDAHKIFGAQMPAIVEDIMRAVGASGLDAIYKFATGIDMDVRGDKSEGIEPKTLPQAAGYQGQAWKQRFQDGTQALGSGALFGSFRALSPSFEASASVVKERTDTIKEISDAFRATHEKGGPRDTFGNKKIGISTPIGKFPGKQTDLETEIFAQEVDTLRKELEPALQAVKVAYSQRQSLQNDTSVSPYMKREMQNKYSWEVVETNRRILQDIQRWEWVQSQKYGRPIKLDQFNKDKSMGGL